MDERAQKILKKLKQLRKADSRRELFGAESHRYELARPLKLGQLESFEAEHSVRLPPDYRLFLLQVGNGGAGPFYGLVSLSASILPDLDYPESPDRLRPSIAFPYTEPWNLQGPPVEKEDERAAFEAEYFDPKHTTGLLNISNYGCGAFVCLIVNGPAYGQVWFDDRASDQGLRPFHFGGKDKDSTAYKFLDWYLLWLKRSLKEVSPQPNNV